MQSLKKCKVNYRQVSNKEVICRIIFVHKKCQKTLGLAYNETELWVTIEIQSNALDKELKKMLSGTARKKYVSPKCLSTCILKVNALVSLCSICHAAIRSYNMQYIKKEVAKLIFEMLQICYNSGCNCLPRIHATMAIKLVLKNSISAVGSRFAVKTATDATFIWFCLDSLNAFFHHT